MYRARNSRPPTARCNQSIRYHHRRGTTAKRGARERERERGSPTTPERYYESVISVIYRSLAHSRTPCHAKWCIAPLQLSLDPFQEVRSPYWCRWTQPVSANVSHVLASQRSPSLGPSSFSSSSVSSCCCCSSASSFVDSSSTLPPSLPPCFLTRDAARSSSSSFSSSFVVRLFVLSRSLARSLARVLRAPTKTRRWVLPLRSSPSASY